MMMPDYTILTDRSLFLMLGDYTQEIDRIEEKRPEAHFQHDLPREQVINELKRMTAFISEFSTRKHRPSKP